MATSCDYVIVLFNDGFPLFFGPFYKEEQLFTAAREQRKRFPSAGFMRLTFNSPKDIQTTPFEP